MGAGGLEFGISFILVRTRIRRKLVKIRRYHNFKSQFINPSIKYVDDGIYIRAVPFPMGRPRGYRKINERHLCRNLVPFKILVS